MTKLEALKQALQRDKENLPAADFQLKISKALKALQYSRFTLYREVVGGVVTECDSLEIVKSYVSYEFETNNN